MMKKITDIHVNGRIRIVAGLLILLGFGIACDSSDDDDLLGLQSEASAVYTIKGEVTTFDERPIKNIFVEVSISYDQRNYIERSDTLYTDNNGQFKFVSSNVPRGQTFKIITKDIDGIKNLGYFETDTIVVRFSMNDLTTAGIHGSWDSGITEKDIKIKLKEGAKFQ